MDNAQRAANLANAQALVAALEADDESEISRCIAALAANQRSTVFEEVGRMTREVHEALMTFAEDERLNDLTKADMPDARDRLRYVITLTEQAANRTLTVVEAAQPIADRLTERSLRLRKQLAQVAGDEADNTRLVTVVSTVSEYLESILKNGEILKTQLNEVMMAQEFQDLSGQMLMRVIDLLEQLEKKLVGLLRVTGVPETRAKDTTTQEDLKQGVGPQMPGGGSDVAKSQDDVDDLLASLGF
ncbi:hypothetical protein A9404_03795 [Halothiobacillus diazotrophicus]|uniref:Protein phosphatase CheZ n=1 Tax=Halothiobacillus diazotrophicus TaxID=1860122 RepID=A0A191ZFG1_9GAMM|nr:protein phosphatase CheZ [Halothiobacillus diazotrophicus]ANJ66616.1 hypothetical protein A9404_03795 [Halothiobacillus diazotrophicus]